MMLDDAFVEVLRKMLYISMMLSLPVLAAALVVGLVIGLLQAVTSIQEQTLAFVPKLLAIILIFVLLAPWMMRLITDYGVELFSALPRYGAL
jgi:flagellar biosynthetic protein FliQ